MFVVERNIVLTPFVMADQESLPYVRWLELADLAFSLDDARKEQEQIKEAIRPSVEEYKRITGKPK